MKIVSSDIQKLGQESLSVKSAGWLRRFRAIILGLILIPINVYMLLYMEAVTNASAGSGAGPYPSTISLFANTILFLVILTVINSLFAKRFASSALNQAELLVIYVMLTISTAIVSIDFLDILVPMLTYPFRAATPENRWAETILPHIPRWISVSDPAAVKGWYEGNSSLYIWSNLKPWILPVSVWSAVILVMLFVMFCINTIVRKQWIEHDKLQFPIVELPMQITEPGHSLLKNKLMWIGFSIAAAISIMNGLHLFYPSVPWLQVKQWDISPLFHNKPWNAIGRTPISFYPYAIGLSFLLSLDMLFSCWFFFVMWRVIRILGALYGAYDTTPNFPFMDQQALGAYCFVGIFALWSGRKHLASVMRAAFSNTRGASESDGPMSYRTAAFGFITGSLIIMLFFHLIGLGPWTAIAVIGFYFFLSLAIARMHAEFGPPAHDLHCIGPEMVITGLFGTGAFSNRELTGLSWLWWFNRAYRSIPIAYQLDGLKIAQKSNTSQRYMALAIAVASVAAVISGFWIYINFGYERGAAVGMAFHVNWFGHEAFSSMHGERWISNPTLPDIPSSLAIVWGMMFTAFLYFMKLRMSWWCFHPLGFAVSTSYSIGMLWVPMLIAWLVKLITLKSGGLKAYRVVLNFFMGLLLGDFIVGCLWPIIGWMLNVSTYSFME